MAHSNGKITAPVGIDADIAPVLGVGSYTYKVFPVLVHPNTGYNIHKQWA